MFEGMSGANGCSCMGYNFDSDQDLKIEYAHNGFVFYVQGKYERWHFTSLFDGKTTLVTSLEVYSVMSYVDDLERWMDFWRS